jgi:DNA replication protein DnaC
MTTCRKCESKFNPRHVKFAGRIVFSQTLCDICERELLEPDPDPRETGWLKLCPTLYQNTDLTRLGAWAEKLQSWKYGHQGLVVIGYSGAGKTRAVWAMLERHYKSGHRVIATDSAKFRNSMQAAARDGNLEWWQESLGKVDILFFDDLGQMKMTDSVAESLWSVVERRCANRKPVIITTQYGGENLISQFERQDLGDAVRRRLNEFCDVIQAKPNPYASKCI